MGVGLELGPEYGDVLRSANVSHVGCFLNLQILHAGQVWDRTGWDEMRGICCYYAFLTTFLGTFYESDGWETSFTIWAAFLVAKADEGCTIMLC